MQAGSSIKPEIFSPENVHAVFSIQTVKICARLLCGVAKTSAVGVLFFCFLPEFSSVKIVWRLWTTLHQSVSAKKKKTEVRLRDGHVEHV